MISFRPKLRCYFASNVIIKCVGKRVIHTVSSKKVTIDSSISFVRCFSTTLCALSVAQSVRTHDVAAPVFSNYIRYLMQMWRKIDEKCPGEQQQ